MSSTLDKQQTQLKLAQLNDALTSGTFVQVRHMLNSLSAPNIAALLEASTPKNRGVIWQLIEPEREAEVIAWVNDELQTQFLKDIEPDRLAEMTDDLDDDDIADILQNLPDKVIEEVLASMSVQDRHRVEQILSYDEDSAGGLMDTEIIAIHPRVTLDVVLRYIRMRKEMPPTTDCVFVVNNEDQLVGLLPISRLLTTDPNVTVREVMVTDFQRITADMPASDVAKLFERYDWITAPVVDGQDKLLGRITVDDVIDVIIDEADHSLMSMAGLSEAEDVFSPALKAAPRRAIWLGINLITAFVATRVIGYFEESIMQVVALAVLMPIVASMGGVAGTQTLTIVIRGLALQQINKHNFSWLVGRELLAGLGNGVLLGGLIGLFAGWLYHDLMLGVVIGAAILINMFVAALGGAVIPVAMEKIKIDPALAGGVVLTALTDCMGFLSFLGLATWLYLS